VLLHKEKIIAEIILLFMCTAEIHQGNIYKMSKQVSLKPQSWYSQWEQMEKFVLSSLLEYKYVLNNILDENRSKKSYTDSGLQTKWGITYIFYPRINGN